MGAERRAAHDDPGHRANPRPRFYLPEGQIPFSLGPRTLVVRVEPGTVETVVPALRATISEVDARVPIIRVERLDDVARTSIARSRFQTMLLTIFAAVALGLGAVGVYGVVAYAVARRAKEVGVRIALGASRPNVLRDVLGNALTPVGLGLLAGLAMAAALSRTLTALVYGVDPLDPLSFGLAPALLLGVATTAALMPALRACRIDPVRTLREE